VSKIFDLDPPSTPSNPEIKRQLPGDGASRKKTCNDCNRQYCREYPFCREVKEENVVTACFRESSIREKVNCRCKKLMLLERDSAKDQAVVYIFIIATVGLLSYAAVRPWVERWAEVGIASSIARNS